MNMKSILIAVIITAFLSVSLPARAGELKPVKLLPPQTDGGKPLMQALKERKSARDFISKELPLQVLSDMLWAACGINRPDTLGRTAPSAKDFQEIDIYVVKAEGIYLYNAKDNMLEPVLSGDIRALTGNQPFVKDAPVNLVFVADISKMGATAPGIVDFYAAADTGFISENVYLFCASAGLGTVVRGWLDKEALAKAMGLKPNQKIVLAQTVGYIRG